MATQGDFDRPVSGAGEFLPDHWSEIVRVIRSMQAVWRAMGGIPGKFIQGAEPTDALQGFALGSGVGNGIEWRIWAHSATVFKIQRNTGTEAVPVWADFAVWDSSDTSLALTKLTVSGTADISGALTIGGGNLDLGGNDLINTGNVAATTFAGISVTAHAARHAPGGADALGVATPVAVGGANAAGVATTFPRSDHVHKGVHSIDEDGSGSPISGDVNLVSGTGIAISRSGQDITVAVSQGAPDRTRTVKTDSNQTIGASATADITLLVNITPPGTADGVKSYLIHGIISAHASVASQSGLCTLRIHMGPLGTGSDPSVKQFQHHIPNEVAGKNSFLIPFTTEEVPAAGDKISLSATMSTSTGAVIHGSGSTVTLYSEMTVEEVFEA